MGDVLIIVHPGSACGSADLNLGRQEASAARATLAAAIEGWEPPSIAGIIVIDGALSDELGRSAYRYLGEAIESKLDTCRAKEKISLRVWGCDDQPPHHDEAVDRLVCEKSLDPQRHRIVVTGAWRELSGESGCVNAVADRLAGHGFEVAFDEGAVLAPSWGDEDDLSPE